jgi:hypothetical protein
VTSLLLYTVANFFESDVTIANDNKIYIADALGVMLTSTAHQKDLFKDKKISKTIKKINKALGQNHLFTSLAW